MTSSDSSDHNPHPIDVAPGTIVVFSDLLCPFTHVAVHRLVGTRARLGLDDDVRLDHHAFPIELLDGAPGTRRGSDSEIPTLGTLEPAAGWQLWQRDDFQYPNTVLLAFEAVQAAKAQGLHASEALDRSLRRAFWQRSATIQIFATIVEIAAETEHVDAERLADDLASGCGRRAVFDDFAIARTDAVTMSPHLFLPDGSSIANPGLTVRWEGAWAAGFPVVVEDDPTVYEGLLRTAAGGG